jgi:hypothetical protein
LSPGRVPRGPGAPGNPDATDPRLAPRPPAPRCRHRPRLYGSCPKNPDRRLGACRVVPCAPGNLTPPTPPPPAHRCRHRPRLYGSCPNNADCRLGERRVSPAPRECRRHPTRLAPRPPARRCRHRPRLYGSCPKNPDCRLGGRHVVPAPRATLTAPTPAWRHARRRVDVGTVRGCMGLVRKTPIVAWARAACSAWGSYPATSRFVPEPMLRHHQRGRHLPHPRRQLGRHPGPVGCRRDHQPCPAARHQVRGCRANCGSAAGRPHTGRSPVAGAAPGLARPSWPARPAAMAAMRQGRREQNRGRRPERVASVVLIGQRVVRTSYNRSPHLRHANRQGRGGRAGNPREPARTRRPDGVAAGDVVGKRRQIGRGVAELIAEDGYTSLDLSPLGCERLVEGRKSIERAIPSRATSQPDRASRHASSAASSASCS